MFLHFAFWQYLPQVGESLLPQGGEGLFAKKDFALKEVVSLYNGIKIKCGTYAAEHMPRYIIQRNTQLTISWLYCPDLTTESDWTGTGTWTSQRATTNLANTVPPLHIRPTTLSHPMWSGVFLNTQGWYRSFASALSNAKSCYLSLAIHWALNLT